MKKCYVIGVCPPPYGGATIKCKLFCELLERNNIETMNIDLMEGKRNALKWGFILFKCIKAFCSKESIVYAIDSKRMKVLLRLQNLFAKSFPNTTILVVGGVLQNKVKEDKWLLDRLKKCKGLWVETEGMKQQFIEMGFRNCLIFPNPKSEKGKCSPQIRKVGEKLRLVYFSQISEEKGVDEILKTVQLLNKSKISYKLDFYGHIVSDFNVVFQEFIRKNENVRYCGVFDTIRNNVYQKLNEYDILLFPTKHAAEGVPGILVEAKMAGVAVIASDRYYNEELVVEADLEGKLVHQDYAQEMYEIIVEFDLNRDLLNKIKRGSFKSSERYTIEKYNEMVNAV